MFGLGRFKLLGYIILYCFVSIYWKSRQIIHHNFKFKISFQVQTMSADRKFTSEIQYSIELSFEF